MQKLFFTLTKSVFIMMSLITLATYSSLANASLSTKAATPNQILNQQVTVKNKVLAKDTSNHHTVSNANKVLSTYRQWAGTRYRLGGTTKAGIDCSAFVRTTMSNAFNIHLPRSTAEQRHAGKSISKSDLKPGDLVFFRKNNHVGVYIGGGKFVHASSSRGVITSSLSEKYWAKTYTQSRRVL
ncbi:C40 family peptidase [Ursidibacter maritimus]|uniref:C40 family peptidase n=1 Tax=Ursidibacter maritimus TaxID=1331689 RepID=A0A949T297_9PAST|nr:peptidase C40 [Ursidibacter maritimus]MBV6524010.1 C40 family peptidase [Ursidibacter maritimus]MBV6526336.1 C40 family peptidase [Ursidibacter maritimus]MBV6528468.1 C40 family peptidase [Ursidibacter maritimus]MBV6529780.1 C40 family peptidase [Ursidibacter maritimus]